MHQELRPYTYKLALHSLVACARSPSQHPLMYLHSSAITGVPYLITLTSEITAMEHQHPLKNPQRLYRLPATFQDITAENFHTPKRTRVEAVTVIILLHLCSTILSSLTKY